ncbi:Hypothetical predicted protein [Mytilus galloprovincialis]|uniref:Uncharacterized protein n=1 Tax=Mytilus galloprovincialis TaxID=29158 RepID=A0A8B6CTU2_MYTGA|nr:Hypothetical predicted protein [Mytilus galloprovincialis]
MHIRPSRSKRSEFQFKIGDNLLQITDTYKYLGVTFHDLKDFKGIANRLSEAGGRALGGVSKSHHLKDFGIKTFQHVSFFQMAAQSCVNVAQSAFVCQLCDHNKVEWKCEECGIFLCSTCKEKIHPRLKSSEKHRIVSIQDIWKNKEPWNYGKMTRVEADTLLKKYKHMGDGAFLVRESKTLTGNYIISILIKDETVHLRIHTKEESGQLKYDFNGNLFDSLHNYIEFLKHDSSDQSSYNPCMWMIIKQVDRTETRLNKVHTFSNQNHIVAINSIQGIIKKDQVTQFKSLLNGIQKKMKNMKSETNDLKKRACQHNWMFFMGHCYLFVYKKE